MRDVSEVIKESRLEVWNCGLSERHHLTPPLSKPTACSKKLTLDQNPVKSIMATLHEDAAMFQDIRRDLVW